jgi:hypothetical protein
MPEVNASARARLWRALYNRSQGDFPHDEEGEELFVCALDESVIRHAAEQWARHLDSLSTKTD